MSKKIKHKDNFIKEYGQEMWELVCAHKNKNDKSPEATEAHKLYMRLLRGADKDCFEVYAICEGDRFIYIGSTSNGVKNRWTNHKSNARTNSTNYPIHNYMNEIVDQNGGTYEDFFHTRIIEQFDNEDDAKRREVELIEFYKPPFNKYKGGGPKRGCGRKQNEFI